MVASILPVVWSQAFAIFEISGHSAEEFTFLVRPLC